MLRNYIRQAYGSLDKKKNIYKKNKRLQIIGISASLTSKVWLSVEVKIKQRFGCGLQAQVRRYGVERQALYF